MRLKSIVARVSVLLLITGCGGDLTGPLTTNIAAARRAWLAHRPADYSFQFAQATEWSAIGPYNGDPGDNFYTVTVAGDHATAWSNSKGETILSPPGPT